MSNSKRTLWLTLLIFGIILIDQVLKIWIKTHMQLGESYEITKWFYIYFVENNGMAFGVELIGKLFLTIFRLFAIVAIGYWLIKLLRKGYKMGFLLCVALIFAGATGNLIDCVFYGQIFEGSLGQVASIFPESGGYAPYLYGKVVDMFYFPLIESNYPSWVPYVGGDHFIFFSPVFNVADSAISVGVFLVLCFYRKTLSHSLEEPEK